MKKKMIKRIAAIVLLMCLLFALTGCHGKQKSVTFAVPEQFDDQTPVEIIFWAKNDTNRNQVAVYQQAIDSGLDAAAGHNGLALCMIETGEYQKALQQIHEGLMTGEGTCSEELRFNEIIVYERQGEFETAIEKMESFIEAYPGNEEAKREYLFLQSRMKEINSMPEDVSGKVWADIVRQWEEEEASAGGETNEETGQDYGYTEDEGYYEDGGETYDDGYYE